MRPYLGEAPPPAAGRRQGQRLLWQARAARGGEEMLPHADPVVGQAGRDQTWDGGVGPPRLGQGGDARTAPHADHDRQGGERSPAMASWPHPIDMRLMTAPDPWSSSYGATFSQDGRCKPRVLRLTQPRVPRPHFALRGPVVPSPPAPSRTALCIERPQLNLRCSSSSTGSASPLRLRVPSIALPRPAVRRGRPKISQPAAPHCRQPLSPIWDGCWENNTGARLWRNV